MIVRAVRDGDFQRACAEDSPEPLRERRTQYDSLISDIRKKFSRGEDTVAMWTAVELYAAWEEPLHYLHDLGVPRQAPSKHHLPSIDLNNPPFTLPRAE